MGRERRGKNQSSVGGERGGVRIDLVWGERGGDKNLSSLGKKGRLELV